MESQVGGTVISPDGKIIRKGWEFVWAFGVLVDTNQAEQRLERDSPIQGETITGIQVRRKTTSSKSINGNDIVNDSVFCILLPYAEAT